MTKNVPHHFFEKFASTITLFTGSTVAFLLAFGLVLVWGLTGPLFHYSENWQLVINTGTTIVTFLMVFLIQKTQNKDSMAMQIKLDELIAASDLASNRIVSVENMTENDLKVIRKYYAKLSKLAHRDEKLTVSHSIDEAERTHDIKKQKRKAKMGTRHPGLRKTKTKSKPKFEKTKTP